MAVGYAVYLAECRELLARLFPEDGIDAWLARHWSSLEAAITSDGRSPGFERALAALPATSARTLNCTDTVFAGAPVSRHDARPALRAALAELLPWRKGPFVIGGVTVDAEWRSNLKWQRVLPHIAPLKGRRVADVGCGNGYYAWQMLHAGAAAVVGFDPSITALAQFRAVRSFAPPAPVMLLPAGGEVLDNPLRVFDTVFSMGVLYHRRDPCAHLRDLARALRAGGEVVLETLVVDGAGAAALAPAGRYARMRNVWCIPTPPQVNAWLRQSGFREPRCVDITVTTPVEQRATAWMPYQSLRDFLDPVNAARTIEGYPAPRRAIFVATAVPD